MFVGVLQANVQNRRRVAAVEAFLQLFFGDAFDSHGAILSCASCGRQAGFAKTSVGELGYAVRC